MSFASDSLDRRNEFLDDKDFLLPEKQLKPKKNNSLFNIYFNRNHKRTLQSALLSLPAIQLLCVHLFFLLESEQNRQFCKRDIYMADKNSNNSSNNASQNSTSKSTTKTTNAQATNPNTNLNTNTNSSVSIQLSSELNRMPLSISVPKKNIRDQFEFKDVLGT